METNACLFPNRRTTKITRKKSAKYMAEKQANYSQLMQLLSQFSLLSHSIRAQTIVYLS